MKCSRATCFHQAGYGASKRQCKVHSKTRLCEECDTSAGYGFTKRTHCLKHRHPDMTSLRSHSRCIVEGCSKYPRYRLYGQKLTHCTRHKLDEQKCVRTICDYELCDVRARYGLPGVTVSRCGKHKDHGMISPNQICTKPDCIIRSTYGYPGQKVIRCSNHALDGMISNPRNKCEVCGVPAIFGIKRPTHCEAHKGSFHNNLVQRTCSVCSVLEIVDAEQKCGRCSQYLRQNMRLLKQRQVKAVIDASDLPTYDSYDRTVYTPNCGKERPDFLWDAGTHTVILAVDEDQHRHYKSTCEDARMKNVTYGLGHPTYWLRYNPDEYRGGTTSENLRHTRLVEAVREAVATPPAGAHECCRVRYLFYDDNDQRQVTLEVL